MSGYTGEQYWAVVAERNRALNRAEKAEAEARTCAEDYADQSDRYDRLEASLRESDAALQAARAVIARVAALAAQWQELSVTPAGFYAEAAAYAEGREAQAESCAEDLLQVLESDR